jgi:hypothetical protein
MNDPTCKTSTFNEWHRALCEHARNNGGSASTLSGWMRRLFDRHYTPAEAWEAFTNNEV